MDALRPYTHIAKTLFGLAFALVAPAQSPAADGEVVVLLHGLLRSARAMRPLETAASRAGFRVVNLDYDTRTEPAAILADLSRRIDQCCREAERVHFITHSLGGIVVRGLLADKPMPNLGRVVMMAPPNRGSEIVDRMGSGWLFRKVFGPTGVALGTGAEAWPQTLPNPDFELGVIAASSSLNPVGSWMIPGDDDGAVGLESTKIEGMADFVLVRSNHTLVMRNGPAIDKALHFLKHGRFPADE